MSTDMTGFYTPQPSNPWAQFQAATPSLSTDTPSPWVGDMTASAAASAPAAGAAATPWYSGFLGTKNTDGTQTQGWGAPALGAAQGIFNAWMGMKQYGLAKQQLAEGQRQFQLNYDAQRTATNTQLQDRQAARVASNPNAYQSVSDYMAANGIKPSTGG